MWTLKLVLLFSLLKLSLSVYCKDAEDVEENCCVLPTDLTNETCTRYDGEVTWSVEDKKIGKVNVQFPTHSSACAPSEYRFELFVKEVTNEGECRQVKDADIFKNRTQYLHTELEYTVTNENAHQSACKRTCEQNETVVFDYVFTGCYFLKIIHHMGEESFDPFFLNNKFIYTDFLKSTDRYTPTIYVSPKYADTSVSVFFRHPLLFGNAARIGMQIFCADTALCEHLNKYQGARHLAWPKSATLNENESSNMEVCVVAESQKDISVKDCNFKNMEGSPPIGQIECTYQGIKNGTYHIIFTILDPIRCKPFSLWDKRIDYLMDMCEWHTEKNISFDFFDTTNIEAHLIPDDLIGLKFAVIAGFIFLAVMGIIVYIVVRKEWCKRNVQIIRDVSEPVEPLRPKLFLLYARDCNPFNEMMEAFRTVLSIDEQFDVYDIQDKARFNEIAENPETWITTRLQTCKIILIASKCAAIQNELQNTESLIYRLSECFDSAFLLALGHINRHIINKEPYRNLLVVKLSFDTEEYKTFKFLNPYTRLDIPDKYPAVLNEIKEISSIDIEENQHTIAYSKFLEKYDNYKEFYTKNPNYLIEILNIEEIKPMNE